MPCNMNPPLFSQVNNSTERADFLSQYLYIRRTQESSTQTDEHENSKDSRTDVDILKIKTSQQDSPQTDNSSKEQVVEESIDNKVELSDEMLTPDCNWDDYHPIFDISRVTVKSSCVCEVDVLDQHNEVEAKLRNIETTSSVTEQLELCSLLDNQEILTAQNEDPILIEVTRWLKEGKLKKLQRLRLPADMITYWKHLNLITVKVGILCKKMDQTRQGDNEIEIQRFLVLVPESLKETVLDQHHPCLVSMHPGVDNTCNLIRQRYYWPRMTR